MKKNNINIKITIRSYWNRKQKKKTEIEKINETKTWFSEKIKKLKNASQADKIKNKKDTNNNI